jgi:K+-transporting ATPase ATPase C chain
MLQTAIIAIRATIVTLVITGIAYPLVMTGLGQVLFSHQANGSLVKDEQGRIVGSALIGQNFAHPTYFWPRPSAAGEKGYDATASGGSNLGATSQKLRDRITTDLARLSEANPDARGPVPVELVTASASGLDPHLSPAAALWQRSRDATSVSLASRA